MDSVEHDGNTYVAVTAVVNLLADVDANDAKVYAWRLRQKLKLVDAAMLKTGKEIGCDGHSAIAYYVTVTDKLQTTLTEQYRDSMAYDKLLRAIRPHVRNCSLGCFFTPSVTEV